MHGAAAAERLRRAFGQRDEAGLAFLDQLRHGADAFLDRHVRIDPRHAKHVERLDAEILQALLAGLTQITRIAAAAYPAGRAVAGAAALGVDDGVVAAAAQRLADQPGIMALAVARRCVEEVHAEIEGALDGGDRLGVVGRTIDAGHAVAAEPDDRHHEIGIAEFAALHRSPVLFGAESIRSADARNFTEIAKPELVEPAI